MTKTTETIAAEKTETSGIDDEETAEFLICRMDDTFYAFYTTDIERVRPYISITFVPGCPDYVLGVIHIKGEIESVIDLRPILGLPQKAPDSDSRIIIAVRSGFRTGILLDSVEDIVSIPLSRITPPLSSFPDAVRMLISGEFVHHDQHVVILDFQKIRDIIAGTSDAD